MKIYLTFFLLILGISLLVQAQEEFTIEENTGEGFTYEDGMTYPEAAPEAQEDMQFQSGEERDWSLASEDMNQEDYQE